MKWRDTQERAQILSLIRDGQAVNLSELLEKLGINDLSPTIRTSAELRVFEIVADLTDAGLVSKEGEMLGPTKLIAKIQKALNISLSELSNLSRRGKQEDVFVEKSVIVHLGISNNNMRYDLSKVVRFCEELNSSYASGNYLASSLLIRALLNHVPPIFGYTTFQQVVNHSRRSIKELLKPLEEISRDVADLHTHSVIQHKENLPTKHQVEPFKANIEVLLHEIIVKTQEQG